MKKAFTLIELIVVIGIIAVLMSVLMVHISNSTDSARAVKCLANMGNLARAVQQYGSVKGVYPIAGSVERLGFDESQGISNVKERYSELPGWVSWNSAGQYRNHPSSHIASAGFFTSAYDPDEYARDYCLTNGALWKYIGANASCYTCPDHVLKMEKKQIKPIWSYVMNGYFGYDESRGGGARSERWGGIEYNTVAKADRRLLFAELQWEDLNGAAANLSSSAGFENDCTLQYKEKDGAETIGFNHKSGKNIVAHVAYADGHTDRLTMPKRGLGTSELVELTKWLCEGKDVSFNGNRDEELKD